MHYLKLASSSIAALWLTACVTTRPPKSSPETGLPPEIITAPPADPKPDAPKPAPAPDPVIEPIPAPAPEATPDNNTGSDSDTGGHFDHIPYWQNADHRPALSAFVKSCKAWDKKDDTKKLHSHKNKFGHYGDWRLACMAAQNTDISSKAAAKLFFESYFAPVELSNTHDKAHLTAYYAPEIPVRKQASLEFSEPILARPKSKKIQNLPRKQLNAKSSRVLAYGRPADVFFLQIQGSGSIRFADGTVYMAAFDGHNGHPYTSIGKLMLKRGLLKPNQASKADIEEWMEKAGYAKTKAIMNENARYIFFKTEYINPGEGPKGAQRVPLTPMGSLAVDPKFTPYGAPVWVVSKFPAFARDYKGTERGHLLIAQDTGSAIKGKMRGDVFFGIGDAAGKKAGVMNHKGKWFVLLPKHLVQEFFGTG